nr:hypothetical protein [Parafrankia sp. BMG5.11]
MRVEAGQHAVDRAANQLVVIDRLDIARLDPLVDCEQLGKLRPGTAIDLGEASGGRRQQRDGADQSGGADESGNLHGAGVS